MSRTNRSSICICCAVAAALLCAHASAEVVEDENDDEVLPSEETLPPGEAEAREAGETGDTSRRRFAFRMGAVPVLNMPGAAGVKDQHGGALVGFTYSIWPRTGGTSYELGLDVTTAEVEHATGGGSSSTVFAGRLGLVWTPPGDAPDGPYLTAGLWGFAESAEILDQYVDGEGPYLNGAASCALGAGLVFGEGRFDLRVEQTIRALSTSPTSMMVVTAGVRF